VQISCKIEVFVGLPPPGASDLSQCTLKRLGYLSLDPNERSNHQARELKSVHVDTPAHVIKFVLHKCHPNKLNIYNQVRALHRCICGC
jgi:centrosomal protein CEP104